MRLIDADALIEEALTEGAYGYVDAKQIADAPTVDAAPVRHGHWIIGADNDDFDIKCSKCKWTDTFEVAGIAAVERIAKAMHYCTNCGAKMMPQPPKKEE